MSSIHHKNMDPTAATSPCDILPKPAAAYLPSRPARNREEAMKMLAEVLARREEAKEAALAEKNNRRREKLAVLRAMNAKRETELREAELKEQRLKSQTKAKNVDSEWVVVDGMDDWEVVETA